MTLRLLGKATSINVRKVLWLCTELRLPFELEAWATPDRPTTSPEFLRLNPNGLVPVLVDGDFVLRESNTICRYLAARQGRSDLLPTQPQARAEVEQWMDWQATDLNSAWRYAFMARVRQHPDYRDAQATLRSIDSWNRLMRILDARLQSTGAYVVGPAFTLADIGLALSAQRWHMTPMDKPVLPAVAAYCERLADRPGWREHGANGMP